MDIILDFFKNLYNNVFVLIFSSNNLLFDIIDILIVTYIVYKVIQFMRQTRAEQLIKGLLIFAVAYFVAQLLNLNAVNWVLSMITSNLLVVIVILFHPEIRSLLEKLGRGSFKNFPLSRVAEDEDTPELIDTISSACSKMQKTRTGALIVIERETMLNEIIETGTIVDAACSSNLVNNIFFKNSPLHDGAMIIRDNRVYAASCILPLTQNYDVDSSLGTRHRAAIGISEISDSVTIVVSEETGAISVVCNGRIERNFNKESLNKKLSELLIVAENSQEEKGLARLFKKKKDGGKNGKD